MIHICDAIMGTGKSSAAIKYINDHKEDRFIYITPYLEEAERIKNGCPDLNFVEPSDKIKKFNFKKSDHTAYLIRHGKNITTTHQAFKNYNSEMLDDIQRQGYRLIIDENIDILERYEANTFDMDMIARAGYIKIDNGICSLTGEEYHGTAFKGMFDMLKTRDLVCVDEDTVMRFYYWVLPPSLITSFKDVIVLTYLFEGQSLHHMFSIYNIEYEYIGIGRTDDGGYEFCEYPGYTPEYVNRLDKMLNIIDNGKLNSVGDDYTALSMNWFDTKEDGVERLKKNISNCMKHIWEDYPAEEKMWGGYKSSYEKMKGKGYTKSFLSFNMRATNNYSDRRCLVYITNLFMNVVEKRFYTSNGIDVDEDKYALSIMVQWIWRSAIRNGEEVYLYIPSKRMRDILKKWISDTMKGGNSIEYRK